MESIDYLDLKKMTAKEKYVTKRMSNHNRSLAGDVLLGAEAYRSTRSDR